MDLTTKTDTLSLISMLVTMKAQTEMVASRKYLNSKIIRNMC